jgi:hypothetical protein
LFLLSRRCAAGAVKLQSNGNNLISGEIFTKSQ